MWKTQVQSLSQEDSMEKKMAIHSSVLAWRIPWMEESGGLQSMGSKRVGHDWETNTFTFIVEQHHITESLFHNRMLTMSYNWVLYWNWKTEWLSADRVIVSISDFYPQDLEADWEMRLPLSSITKSIVSCMASLGKYLHSKFEVPFLLNVDCFHIIKWKEKTKSNRCYVRNGLYS